MKKKIQVVAAVIEKDHEVLIARRAQGRALAGYWEFPGGKIEDGELPERALERELWEELSLHTQTGARIGVSLFTDEQTDIELIAYWSSLISGTPVLKVHTETKWISPHALHRVQLAPADIALISWILAAKKFPDKA